MDLATIEAKINNRAYRQRQDFINDFKLMIENCHTYNGPVSGKSTEHDFHHLDIYRMKSSTFIWLNDRSLG